jgi:hypothetical protein
MKKHVIAAAVAFAVMGAARSASADMAGGTIGAAAGSELDGNVGAPEPSHAAAKDATAVRKLLEVQA